MLDVLVASRDNRLFMSGAQFRSALDGTKIRSYVFTLNKDGDNYVFKGKGYGHGVGLCQWGAKTMAKRGYNARAILRFYYKNTSIRKM